MKNNMKLEELPIYPKKLADKYFAWRRILAKEGIVTDEQVNKYIQETLQKIIVATSKRFAKGMLNAHKE